MADIFNLSGSYSTSPASGFPSGDPVIDAAIAESMVLSSKAFTTVNLDADGAESVSFGDLDEAHVIILRAVGGKVMARFTSADGATQAVPFDEFFAVISSSVPFTALDLTRVAGTSTKVNVFLGEKA